LKGEIKMFHWKEDEVVPRLRSTRRKRVGIQMADAIIEMVHLMYQTQTARVLLEAMIDRLRERIGEF
jgi:diphthamide synthase subunit DPH2